MSDPDESYRPVSREEFNRLTGYVAGLTNAVRALVELAPDKAAALAAVQDCFEYIDNWKREGLDDCLEALKMPIRHDLAKDSDPNGRIAKAEQDYADRQEQLNADVMAKLLRPSGSDSPSVDDSPAGRP
jgi:hypothetical protein